MEPTDHSVSSDSKCKRRMSTHLPIALDFQSPAFCTVLCPRWLSSFTLLTHNRMWVRSLHICGRVQGSAGWFSSVISRLMTDLVDGFHAPTIQRDILLISVHFLLLDLDKVQLVHSRDIMRPRVRQRKDILIGSTWNSSGRIS